ncbi:Ig-like domain-containing protein [Veronia nyctiphanis]|uniref:Ig-like domain-containing protein n=1 Tax=Veronia nyctiphanis TaxID=1278244 RepID=UPI0038B5D3BE
MGADGIINANEAAQNQIVSGSVSGEFNTNDVVTVSVGNNTYSANVEENGNFSVTVPGSVLAAHSAITVTVTATDASGNSGNISTTETYYVEPLPTLSTLNLVQHGIEDASSYQEGPAWEISVTNASPTSGNLHFVFNDNQYSSSFGQFENEIFVEGSDGNLISPPEGQAGPNGGWVVAWTAPFMQGDVTLRPGKPRSRCTCYPKMTMSLRPTPILALMSVTTA